MRASLVCRRKRKDMQEKVRECKKGILERQQRLGSYSLLYLKDANARTLRIGAAKAAEVNRKMIEREVSRLDRQAAFTMAKYNKALAVNQVSARGGSAPPVVLLCAHTPTCTRERRLTTGTCCPVALRRRAVSWCCVTGGARSGG